MKIEVFSGQLNSNVENIFNSFMYRKNTVWWFLPERIFYHSLLQYEESIKLVEKCLKEDKDLFVYTYSEHILNGIRVSIKRNKIEGAKCHQFMNDGSEICAEILKNGSVTAWVDNVFNVSDKALIELL